MAKRNEITILGSGTSTGIPMVGCYCDICMSKNPKDKRYRSSILISTNSNTFLIDTTPDFRTQALAHNINDLDFVIITHEHSDHTNGIDDLRPLTFGPPKKTIPIYTNSYCAQDLKVRYPYIFDQKTIFKDRPILGGGIASLELKEIENNFNHDSEVFETLMLEHGYTKTLGIIHESFAYLIDCNEIKDEQLELMKNKNLDLIIIDCCQIEKHDTHLNYFQAFDYIKKIAPKRAGLIHMNHSLSHEFLETEIEMSFKDSSIEVFPCFDNQILNY